MRERKSKIFNGKLIKQWKLKVIRSAERRGDEWELTTEGQRETHLYGKQEIPADIARKACWLPLCNKPMSQQSLQISPKASEESEANQSTLL